MNYEMKYQKGSIQGIRISIREQDGSGEEFHSTEFQQNQI